MKTIILKFHIKDFDDNCPKVLEQINKIQEQIENSRIKIKFECDGIGAYEFWGAREYDYGSTYLEIEEADDFKLILIVDNKKDWLKIFTTLPEWINFKRTAIEYDEETEYELPVELKFPVEELKVIKESEKNIKIICHGFWEENS